MVHGYGIAICFNHTAESIRKLQENFDFAFGYTDIDVKFGNLSQSSSKIIFRNTEDDNHSIEVIFGESSTVTTQWSGGEQPHSLWIPCTERMEMLYIIRKCADAVHRKVDLGSILWEEANQDGKVRLGDMDWPNSKNVIAKGGTVNAKSD